MMAAAKERISVVRVSRQFVNKTKPKDIDKVQDAEESSSSESNSNLAYPPKTSSNNKASHNIHRKPTDVFTLPVPQTTENRFDESSRHTLHIDRSPRSAVTHHQPVSINTQIKRSLEHESRPFLNWKATGKWSYGLCSLFDDFNVCCYACACWCCFRHELSSMMDEHWSLWFVSCSPLMVLRTKFRQQYGIRGSIAEDFCLSSCCPLCVGVQLANEGREHGHRIYS